MKLQAACESCSASHHRETERARLPHQSGRRRSAQRPGRIAGHRARELAQRPNAWLTFDATRKRSLPNFFGVSPDGRVAAIFCAPEGRSHSIIPLGMDHLRFNFQIDPDTRHDGTLDRSLAYRRLREVYGIGEDDVEIYRQAVYPFEGKLAQTWRDGRVFKRKPHVRVHIDGSDKVGALTFISDPAEAAARDRMFLQGNVPRPRQSRS